MSLISSSLAEKQAEDRALLRRFEPVIRFTAGEQFFPMAVDPYVQASSLWMQRPNGDPMRLVPEGQLTLEKLAEPRAHGFGAVYFLRFIEPINITDLAAIALEETLTRRSPKDTFRARSGRLARVGYGSRFVDALFSLTLLARGRVPGDTALAAARLVRQMRSQNEPFVYYGRVVRRAGWVALQYWYFYPFNNWRSGFSGVNDHEADWEMVYVYLSETENGEVQPEWVAYASHDFAGDDLRRRWDDPEVEKVGEHPVIYTGAGSHASYFSRGEYLAELELPFLSPLVQFVDRVQATWRTWMGWARGDELERHAAFNVFRVPFVDYARGDGLSVGPGGDGEWAEPRLLDPAGPAWVTQYRGLWGLYARDPIAGENAPAGPMYNRDGTVRRSWYDPLGWAGLDKEPPPDHALQRIEARYRELKAHRAGLEDSIAANSQALTGLGVEAKAMLGRPHLKKLYEAHLARIEALSRELADQRAELAADEALLEALDSHAADVQAGHKGPLRAHIHRAHQPDTEAGLRLSRFAEWWAAVSIGLMMVAFVGLVVFARHYLVYGLTAIIALLIFVEAGFRRQLPRLISSVTNALAVVAALVLLFEFFWEAVIIAVLVAGTYIMWENVRELRG